MHSLRFSPGQAHIKLMWNKKKWVVKICYLNLAHRAIEKNGQESGHAGMLGLFSGPTKLFIVPLLFTVDTTAVRLAVQPHVKGGINPLLPAHTEILIMKPDPVFLGQLPAPGDDLLMVLIF